jgi:hypothetical protein
MARTISRNVGRAAANRHDDVVTVQELLNRVPSSEGGPQPKLKVDGLCGPKTKAAIQKFQLHHFGWSGADGRVDPGQRTITKLNEYDRTVKPKFRTTLFTIKPPDDNEIRLATDSYQWWFEVKERQYRGERPHMYCLGNVGASFSLFFFSGTPRHFKTIRPHAASELDCPASYKTYQHRYPGPQGQTFMEWRSYLELRLPSGTVRIPFDSHLVEPDFDGHRRRSSYERRGQFYLFRDYYRYHKNE